ncbi:hypothetical protein Tco_1367347 [Tanacetum coccineum]
MTSEATRSKEINETGINKNEPPRFKQDVQENPHDDGVENKSLSIPEKAAHPLVKPQQSSIPFPNRCLLTNKSRLEEACTETMNKRCSAIFLNELASKEKDPRNFTIPCHVLEKHKEAEDLAADHLSRFESPHMEVLTERDIADKFFDEHLMVLKSKFKDDEPWYADFVNYIVGKVVPLNWTFEKRKRFFSQVKTYFWEEPYAFKLCADNIMRRCVAGSESLKILAHCHSGPTCGHHSAIIITKKVIPFIERNCQIRGSFKLASTLCIDLDSTLTPFNRSYCCDLLLYSHGNYKPTIKDKDGKDVVTPYEKLNENQKKMLSKNDEAKMVLYNALPKKEYERIFMKFLRALPSKWRPKVTAIEESKDLSKLSLDELVGNLKVYEVVLEKDLEIAKRTERKGTSHSHLKQDNSLSDDDASSSNSNDEEYDGRKGFKKFFRRRGTFVRQPYDDTKRTSTKIKEDKKGRSKCFKCVIQLTSLVIAQNTLPGDQKAFVVGSWSDSGDDSKKEEICLMAHSNERYYTIIFYYRGHLKKLSVEPAGRCHSSTAPACSIEQHRVSDDSAEFNRSPKYLRNQRCCLTSWMSKKQTALAISTTKAEYVSAGKACQQALWMKQALVDYEVKLNDVAVLCDNKGAID